jgi:hypothetical protein
LSASSNPFFFFFLFLLSGLYEYIHNPYY